MQQMQERPAATSAARPVTYSTIVVHAQPGSASSRRVDAAARLAREFDARLIGLGAESFDPVATPDPFTGFAAGEWVSLIQEQIGKDLHDAEAAFRRDAAGADVEWRSVQEDPRVAVSRQASAADLIVVSPCKARDPGRAADPGDVVMSVGRPVLMVPEGRSQLQGRTVVVAWKNSREARRAMADALPFLRRAEDVIVLSVCPEDAVKASSAELEDVVANLKRHGVAARPQVAVLEHHGVADEIERIAGEVGADLIVAGAFGHSRLHEWVLGGVTDDFLHRPSCFVLLSH